MTALTTHERFRRVLDHREADRVPIWDFPWPGTLARWYREGLPPGIGFAEFFDLDKIARIEVDNSPRYPERVVEETEEYKVYTTKWGATQREFKHADSTPEFLGYTVTTPEKWQEAKRRMTPSDDRIPWDYLRQNYGRWRDEGYWIDAKLFFGFDSAHALTVGFETFLLALLEQPQWCADMFNHYLDVSIALQDRVWDAGYKFDSVTWTDDLGYKNGLFFSLDTYRSLLKPVQQRAVQWAHGKGVKVRCHTDGNITALLPELVDIGIDMLHPLEAKAGMNALDVKRQYGRSLTIHGALNALLWTDVDAIEAEIQRLVPVLKQSGGYIFASDHSIPNSVSFENIKAIVALAKKYGSYES
jgi:uroporphyrinogen decarboxylase